MNLPTFAAYFLAVLVLPVVLCVWLIETRTERVARWHRTGLTRTAIASRLGVSRRTVGRILAAA